MTEESAWRAISAEEAGVIRSIVKAATAPCGEDLIDGLSKATVADSTRWILDIRTAATAARCDLPDGPFPARAFVPSKAAYQGEVIVWLTDGRVSGLEYAWIRDLPPTSWPLRDEMEIITQQHV